MLEQNRHTLEKPVVLADSKASKRITIRSPEMQALGRELAKQGEQKRREQEKLRASVTHYYWPSEKDYLVWCKAEDQSEFYLGIEEFCQYAFDHKKPMPMPLRPMNTNKTHQIRYRTFSFLARRWNAGDFTIQFKEI